MLSSKNNCNDDNVITNVDDIDSELPYSCSLNEHIKNYFVFYIVNMLRMNVKLNTHHGLGKILHNITHAN